MPETISSTKLRANLKDALAHVKKSKKPLIITERGTPTCVLLDMDIYLQLLEQYDNKAWIKLNKSLVQRKLYQ